MKVTITETCTMLWHYTCPECGIGCAETEYHAPAHMIYCEVCLEDGRQVRLRRWPVDEESGPAAGGGAG